MHAVLTPLFLLIVGPTSPHTPVQEALALENVTVVFPAKSEFVVDTHSSAHKHHRAILGTQHDHVVDRQHIKRRQRVLGVLELLHACWRRQVLRKVVVKRMAAARRREYARAGRTRGAR